MQRLAHMHGEARLATHHMRACSITRAIASSISEFIVQHARVVKSELTAPPAPATLGDYMRSPAPPPTTCACD